MHTLKFRQYYEGDDDSNPEWNYFDLRNGKMVVDGGWKAPQQFTGLTDCQGVEIYEGDIVETAEDINSIKKGWRFTVDWYAPRLKLYGVGKYMDNTPIDYMEHADIYFSEEDSYIFEVIGNIYENPDLLVKEH